MLPAPRPAVTFPAPDHQSRRLRDRCAGCLCRKMPASSLLLLSASLPSACWACACHAWPDDRWTSAHTASPSASPPTTLPPAHCAAYLVEVCQCPDRRSFARSHDELFSSTRRRQQLWYRPEPRPSSTLVLHTRLRYAEITYLVRGRGHPREYPEDKRCRSSDPTDTPSVGLLLDPAPPPSEKATRSRWLRGESPQLPASNRTAGVSPDNAGQ